MTLPAGWAPLPFDPVRGVPQAVAVPGVPDLSVAVVTAAVDLARLLHAPQATVVTDLTAATGSGPVPAGTFDVPGAGSVPARDSATAAVVALVVIQGASVATTWPAVAGRALPVRAGDRVLGALWVDELVLTVGALVTGGGHGARLSVGWAGPRAVVAAPARTAHTHGTHTREEDPYVGLR